MHVVMKFKVLFLFLCYCIPTLGNDFYWRVVKSEVYRTYYNIFISQWLKEQTSEIKLLDVSVDENTEQAKLVIKNASGFDVRYGLLDLYFYRFLGNCKKKRLANDKSYISIEYEIQSDEEAVIPIDLSIIDSKGLFLIRLVLTGVNASYYVDLYLERNYDKI